jgi:hypothetical protein
MPPWVLLLAVLLVMLLKWEEINWMPQFVFDQTLLPVMVV